jgi:hypothetical protein
MTEMRGSSVSVLVPGEDQLQHLEATEQRFYDLVDWFAAVEMHAWRKVDCYFSSLKPKSIFLVVGQTLATGYSICHKEYGSTACEVYLEADTELPSIVNASMLVNYGCQKAVASTGFEVVRQKISSNNQKHFSIVLDVHVSMRIQRFELKKNLRERVESCYR